MREGRALSSSASHEAAAGIRNLAANFENAPVISTTTGTVEVRVIPTDDELMIARTVFRIVSADSDATIGELR